MIASKGAYAIIALILFIIGVGMHSLVTTEYDLTLIPD